MKHQKATCAKSRTKTAIAMPSFAKAAKDEQMAEQINKIWAEQVTKHFVNLQKWN